MKGCIRARIKTQKQIEKVYPEASCWGKPPSKDNWLNLRSADEVLLPYLGKTVLVRKKRIDLFRRYYVIKDTDDIVIMPDWIDHFDSSDLVPPADYGEGVNESWMEPFEERYFFLNGVLIITG